MPFDKGYLITPELHEPPISIRKRAHASDLGTLARAVACAVRQETRTAIGVRQTVSTVRPTISPDTPCQP
jgi:hypothetical protein